MGTWIKLRGSITYFSDKCQVLSSLLWSVEVQGNSESLSSPHSQLGAGIPVSMVCACIYRWLPADMCWCQICKTEEKT